MPGGRGPPGLEQRPRRDAQAHGHDLVGVADDGAGRLALRDNAVGVVDVRRWHACRERRSVYKPDDVVVIEARYRNAQRQPDHLWHSVRSVGDAGAAQRLEDVYQVDDRPSGKRRTGCRRRSQARTSSTAWLTSGKGWRRGSHAIEAGPSAEQCHRGSRECEPYRCCVLLSQASDRRQRRSQTVHPIPASSRTPRQPDMRMRQGAYEVRPSPHGFSSELSRCAARRGPSQSYDEWASGEHGGNDGSVRSPTSTRVG